MRSVAVVVQPGFAPFEFGLACVAFGLDRSDDGIPNFDFRIVAPSPEPCRPTSASRSTSRTVSRRPPTSTSSCSADPRAQWGSVDERVLEVVRAAHARGAWLLSVCSGSFVIAASGVLDGKRATTHWRYADTLARMYPRIEVDPDVLYVQSGNIITSAGTTRRDSTPACTCCARNSAPS